MKNGAALISRIIALFAWSFIAACSNFSTWEGVIDNSRVNGIVYYLPRGRIRITGDFTPAQGGTASKVPTGTSDLNAPTEVSKTQPSSDPSQSSQSKNFAITVAADIEADPSQRYYLKPNRNYLSDDNIHLIINAKHLLSSGSAVTTDQTGQIIVTTAQIAAKAAESPLGLGTPPKIIVPSRMNISGLISLLQETIKQKPSASDTNIASGSLPGLVDVLGEPPPAKKQGVETLLSVLTQDDSVSLHMVIKMVKLYTPEQASKDIDISNAKAFYDELTRESQPTPATTKPSGQQVPQPKPFNIVFDPSDPTNTLVYDATNKVDTASKAALEFQARGIRRRWTVPDLDKLGFTVIVDELFQRDMALRKSPWQKYFWSKKDDPKGAPGIAFRSVKPYRVSVTNKIALDGDGKNSGFAFYIKGDQLILLPDTDDGHILVMDYSRMNFVTKTTNIGFVDGEPQDFAQTVPSPILGFLAIPKGIVDALVPNPLTPKPAATPAPQGNAPAVHTASQATPKPG